MVVKFFNKIRSKKIFLVSAILAAILGVIILAAGLILLVTYLGDGSKEKESKLELANDSQASLLNAAQPYDLNDSTPTFDLYGEIGYVEDENDTPSVMLRSDYSPDAESCGQTDALYYDEKPEVREKCIGLSKEKLVIPNHATLQTYNGTYKLYHNADKSDWDWVDEYAYALLPDGSMVNMANAKIQFNFYDNETRIVQMEGRAYYRIKAQPEGHKFTIQVGDRIIELSDAETQIMVDKDKTAMDKDRDTLNNLYVDEKSGEEVDQELMTKLKSQAYEVDIIQFAGTGKMYTRGSDSKKAVVLDDSDNSYKKFAFKDYKNRETTDATQEVYEREKETILSSYYFTGPAMFSIENYGLGNFNSVSVEDLYKMLMVYFDNASAYAYTSAMQYKKDMDEFTTEWNNFIKKTGTCKDGWYKATEDRCCPDGYKYNSSKNLCTKTTYTYYCENGWTLGSDNMCHKQGSSTSEQKTPTYNPGSGTSGDICVDSSKPASYQLCKMGVSAGSGHMSGSKCCFASVADPKLE